MSTRVYEAQELATGTEIVLGERNQQHLVRVLRMDAGDAFVIFNGDGSEYGARIVSAGKRDARVLVGARREPAVESLLLTHLGQVMSKGDRMEYAVQKAAEMGVNEITLLSSERCDIRLDGDRLAKKRDHLQMVVIAACEQSGRVRIPVVHGPVDFDDWIGAVKADAKFVLMPVSERASLPEKAGSVALVAGPEGGLTGTEEKAALAQGFTSLQLGPRVLRTETAPVAALAFLQARYGDFC